MKITHQKRVLYTTLALAFICLGFIPAWYLGLHAGKCKAIVERHWREFELDPNKVVLGTPASNPSIVYGRSIREIWPNPDTKEIKIYFKCDPPMTSGDSDGYAFKNHTGVWHYKIP